MTQVQASSNALMKLSIVWKFPLIAMTLALTVTLKVNIKHLAKGIKQKPFGSPVEELKTKQ